MQHVTSLAHAAAPPAGRASMVLLWLSLAAYMLLSSHLLLRFGIPYQVPGGSMVVKLHPGTYLLLLAALALPLETRGNPLRTVGRLAALSPATTAYLLMAAFFLAYSGMRYGPSGSAFIIDTLIMPAIAVILVAASRPATARRLFGFMVAVVCVNSTIAIGEAILHVRLVPLSLGDGPVFEDPFRSSALMGHPLQNSFITAPMIFAVLATPWRAAIRWPVVLLMLLGLVTFGSRTAVALAAAGLVAHGVATAVFLARRRRVTYLGVTGGLSLLGLALPLVVLAVVELNLGERLIAHMRWDDSAQVRLVSLQAFRFVTVPELLFGISPRSFEVIMHRLSLGDLEAIENAWVLLILQMGLVLFLPFALLLLAMMWSLVRGAPFALKLALLVFLVAASSNNSLATKSAILLIVLVAVAAVRRAGSA